MDHIQPLRERRDEEDFESYVEHALRHIDRRFSMEGSTEAALAAAVGELADAIPKLASALQTYADRAKQQEADLQDAISAKEQAIAQAAGDEAQITQLNTELATARGELSAIQATTGELAPIAESAKEVASKLPAAEGAPAGGTAAPGAADAGAAGAADAGTAQQAPTGGTS
jgi:uncharacterized phage infection (PIP) family protein YhgE